MYPQGARPTAETVDPYQNLIVEKDRLKNGAAGHTPPCALIRGLPYSAAARTNIGAAARIKKSLHREQRHLVGFSVGISAECDGNFPGQEW